MKIELPRKVVLIIKNLQRHGYDAYAVGGCVRDSILNQKTGGLGYHDFCKAGAGEADLPTYRRHWDRAWDGNSSDWKRRI